MVCRFGKSVTVRLLCGVGAIGSAFHSTWCVYKRLPQKQCDQQQNIDALFESAKTKLSYFVQLHNSALQRLKFSQLASKAARMLSYDYDSEPSAEELASNCKRVANSISEVSGGREVRLVAVSKTKSPACIKRFYDQGHRVFGENYVQEIVEKAGVLPQDIQWHFIGHLQSNKVRELLLGVPSLAVVESVDSSKLADKLNTGCERYREGRLLDVFLQVNTSGEESKSGTEPGPPTTELAVHINERCPYLRLRGLMTIGMKDYTSQPENFICLINCREEVARVCGMEPRTLELSMGMSGDYLSAITMGSTTVRVGSALFGQRVYKNPK